MPAVAAASALARPLVRDVDLLLPPGLDETFFFAGLCDAVDVVDCELSCALGQLRPPGCLRFGASPPLTTSIPAFACSSAQAGVILGPQDQIQITSSQKNKSP